MHVLLQKNIVIQVHWGMFLARFLGSSLSLHRRASPTVNSRARCSPKRSVWRVFEEVSEAAEISRQLIDGFVQALVLRAQLDHLLLHLQVRCFALSLLLRTRCCSFRAAQILRTVSVDWLLAFSFPSRLWVTGSGSGDVGVVGDPCAWSSRSSARTSRSEMVRKRTVRCRSSPPLLDRCAKRALAKAPILVLQPLRDLLRKSARQVKFGLSCFTALLNKSQRARRCRSPAERGHGLDVGAEVDGALIIVDGRRVLSSMMLLLLLLLCCCPRTCHALPGFDIPWHDFIVIEVGWLHGPAHVAWWRYCTASPDCICQTWTQRNSNSISRCFPRPLGSPQKRNFSRAITHCLAQPARISKSLAVSRAGVKVLVALYRNSAVCVHKYERSAASRHHRPLPEASECPASVTCSACAPIEETRVYMTPTSNF